MYWIHRKIFEIRIKEDKIVFYKKNKNPFSMELFKEPTKEYRGAPFWAWNCKLDKEILLEQLDFFKEMGMGGAHIHCRVGLDTPYMGTEFLDMVKACEEKMKKEDLLCWLYDEDRWPSGSAGGMVTKNEKYRSRFLVFEPYGIELEEEKSLISAAKAIRSNNRKLIGYYQIELDEMGYLKSYKFSRDNEFSKVGEVWVAWLEISGGTPWFNNQSYVNTLDKEAINCFIQTTHEKYYKNLGSDFGKNIPAIFTDEPQVSHKEALTDPFEKKPITLPYTDDFNETFEKKYYTSIEKHIPELIWEQKDSISSIRYLYHRHIGERFAHAFCDNVGDWCTNHNLMLTGHMMNEWTLYSQTAAIGEIMRPLKHFALPGIDMLCDRRELSTIKQVQSVSHQMGREGVASEIYGVTGWPFDFRHHKLAGDWQAALGVTVRIPHLTWVSMAGEGKRDYPASIGYQSPWYREYKYIEDHFARLSTALTRGKPCVKVGVIHPVESYWMYWGNQKQTSSKRMLLEDNFQNIIDWLLYGLIDFDFVSEAILDEQKEDQKNTTFKMGTMEYEVMIVPGCATLRTNTVKQLSEFRKNGGQVLFIGDIAGFVDGKSSELVKALSMSCDTIAFDNSALLDYLEDFREIDISETPLEGLDNTKLKHIETGYRSNKFFYQLRKDIEMSWLFISHSNNPENQDIIERSLLKIEITGEHNVVLFNTLTGETEEVLVEYQNGKTIIQQPCAPHDSFLYQFKKGKKEVMIPKVNDFKVQKIELPQPVSFNRHEENVLLLDMAEYSFDNGDWQAEEEVLRIDNLFREKLGYPLRMEALAQPWVEKQVLSPEHLLSLRFSIYSETELKNISLAVEDLENIEVYLDDKMVINNDIGWYVDHAIRRVKLPDIDKGVHKLVLKIPFTKKTNVEWCYLLGQFAVQVRGRKKEITCEKQDLMFGDLSNQGMPFYGGNLTYESVIDTDSGNLNIEISEYRGALIKVQVDDNEMKNLIFSPYRIDCGYVDKGKHIVKITVFGTRCNTFGPLHNNNKTEEWYGPNIWRTKDSKWTYEYQLEKTGVLKTPLYWITEEDKNE